MKKAQSIVLFSFIFFLLLVEGLGAKDDDGKRCCRVALFCGPYFNGGVKAGGGAGLIYNFTESISLVGELNVKFSEPKVYIVASSFIYNFNHKLICPFAAAGVATKIMSGSRDTDLQFGGGLVYSISNSFKLRFDARLFMGDGIVEKGAKLVICYIFHPQ